MYQKPPDHYLITEATPLHNPFWDYARHKIACEERLLHAHRFRSFPVTIVRPSHTYGPTWIPAAIGGHGYTLVDRTDRIEEGLALIERALALRPDSAAIIDSHGWALFRLGRVEEAEAELRRAFELQPDPEIAAHLGEVLWKLGRHQDAKAIWDQGRELDPENRLLMRTVQRLSE